MAGRCVGGDPDCAGHQRERCGSRVGRRRGTGAARHCPAAAAGPGAGRGTSGATRSNAAGEHRNVAVDHRRPDRRRVRDHPPCGRPGADRDYQRCSRRLGGGPHRVVRDDDPAPCGISGGGIPDVGQRDRRDRVPAHRGRAADRGTRRVFGCVVRSDRDRRSDRAAAPYVRRRRSRPLAGATRLMTALLLTAIVAPIVASFANLVAGWRRWTSALTVLSAVTILASGVALALRIGSGQHIMLGGILRADGLSVLMLIVIGVVGTLTTWASIGYIDSELEHAHTDASGARIYGALTPAFLAAMALAVCANNIGIVWVAIEATTVITAFLVGHRRTRTALEATWKYVIICSVGIAVAFLGTVLLYYAAQHAGAPSAQALNLDVLFGYAGELDPGVTRLAGGLLLIGYGAKAGLFPFHTWL